MKPLLLKFPVAFLLLLLIAGTSNSQLINKKDFRLKDSKSGLMELSKPIEPISKNNIAKNNSPFMAGALSFIVPGAALGQIYNRQYLNFGIRLGISAISILGIVLSGGVPHSDGKGNDALIPLALLYAANWISSIFDAVIYNKKHLSGR